MPIKSLLGGGADRKLLVGSILLMWNSISLDPLEAHEADTSSENMFNDCPDWLLVNVYVNEAYMMLN